MVITGDYLYITMVITVDNLYNIMVKFFITLAHGGKLKYRGKSHEIVTLEKVKISVNNYRSIFITLALGAVLRNFLRPYLRMFLLS
jgi:hypothetical protein